ncbi:HEPACAM family member 2-like isoform X1 [Mobula hypostoma]|uniref:HEPACAM family member 2-like isoform X1 n=1 Tax=Mobula hypostoma TaxID=723540 RepID=UPI002FC274D7
MKVREQGYGMRTCCGDLLIWLLSAACLALDVKTPDYPVNASLHHQTWLPVQVEPLPQGAEVTWSFQSNASSTLIARYETDTKKVKYFVGKQLGQRFMMLDNFTLWINSVKWEDAGTYIVTVFTPTEWKADTSLRVYEPVSNVTVEVLNITSGQSCNVTLRCSAAAGNKLSFGWSPRNGTALGQISDRGADLSLSLASSDTVDYACTVWNPVSQATAHFSSEHACQQEASRIPMALIAISCLICVILCIIVVYIYCRKCKSVSLTGEHWPGGDRNSLHHHSENFMSIFWSPKSIFRPLQTTLDSSSAYSLPTPNLTPASVTRIHHPNHS